MQIELRECSTYDGNDILEMIREIGPGENGFRNVGYDMSDSDFTDYLVRNVNSSRGIDLEPGRVPQTYFWLIVDGRPVGMGKLRHFLNDHLRKYGGHIGYCIRPTERGKGFGIILLGGTLKKAREMNIPRILITCDDINTASRRVIENNSGVLEYNVGGECYYWIKLDDANGIRQIHVDDYYEIYMMWSRTPGMGLSDADSEVNIRNFLMRNKGMSFCCKDDDKIIATILCGHDGRRGYIYHVTVAPGYRGKGIGRKLVEKSLQKLKEEGIDKCHLFVYADNDTGNAFWRSTDWTKREDIFTYSRNT